MLKFDMWGAGARGLNLISRLKPEHILETIYDNNPNMIVDSDKTILIPQKDTLSMSKNPLIVTPKYHTDKIRQHLESNNIYRGVYDLENYETFLYQFPMEEFVNCHSQQGYIIYGYSLLGILLAEKLKKNGKTYKILVQHSLDDKVDEDLIIEEVRTNKNTRSNDGMLVLLTVDIENEDRDFLSEFECIDMIEEINSSNLYRNETLSLYKNRHKGERCFIVATGPSLKINDLEVLKSQGEICISVNGIFEAFKDTEWRPDYYVVGDPNAVKKNRTAIKETDIKDIFVSDWAVNELEEVDDRIKIWHLDRRRKDGVCPQFSSDFSVTANTGCTIVYDGALQLAAYMGFEKIYLLGVGWHYGFK